MTLRVEVDVYQKEYKMMKGHLRIFHRRAFFPPAAGTLELVGVHVWHITTSRRLFSARAPHVNSSRVSNWRSHDT